MSKPNQFQVALIKLSDGTTAAYTGRAQVFEGDTRTVVDITFTEPRQMIEGCEWDTVESLRQPETGIQ